jgi:methyl-accepting chemotaxis protein
MKFNIRNKLIVFAALLIFVPLLLTAVAITFQSKSVIENSAKQGIEKDARMAEKILQARQKLLREVAEKTAQQIATESLIDSAQAPTNATSALGNPQQAAQQSQADGQRRLQKLLETRVGNDAVDFAAVLDTKGKTLMRHNGKPDGGESMSENALVRQSRNKLEEKGSSNVFAEAVLESVLKEDRETLKRFGLDQQAAVPGGDGSGLMIEAVAPVVTGANHLGFVVVGLLVNNAKQERSVANEIKQTLYQNLPTEAISVILLDTLTVASNNPAAVGAKLGSESLKDGVASTNVIRNDGYFTAFKDIKDPDGRSIGRVGVGLTESYVGQPLRYALLSIAVATLISLVGGVVMAIFLSQRLTQPIIRLTEAANRISLGELDDAIAVASDDEIGQLAESLERMRISLKQAIERLRRR